jgi:hypothetical protein
MMLLMLLLLPVRKSCLLLSCPTFGLSDLFIKCPWLMRISTFLIQSSWCISIQLLIKTSSMETVQFFVK